MNPFKFSQAFFPFFLAFLAPILLRAEPYYSAWTGLSCYGCHVNQTGGHLRNAYGKAWGESRRTFNWKGLAEAVSDFASGEPRTVDFGGDLHTSYAAAGDGAALEPGRRTVSLAAYVNEAVRAVYTRDFSLALDVETYALVAGLPANGFVKFGTFHLPYGLTLADDRSLVRAPLGFTFSRRETGVQAGLAPGGILDQRLFVTSTWVEGQGSDHPKTHSTWASLTLGPPLTLGGSCYRQDRDAVGDQSRYSAFGWGRVWRVALLGEYATGKDEVSPAVDRKITAAHGSLEVDLGNSVYLRGVQEFLNPSNLVARDETYRTVVSLRLFPANNLELQLDFERLDPRAGEEEEAFLADANVFF